MRVCDQERMAKAEREARVEKMYLNGYSPSEIAVLLNLSTDYVRRQVNIIVRRCSEELIARGINVVPLKTYEPQHVTVKGKTYLDVTELFIDCGHYYSTKGFKTCGL